jgi:hypothetical protein
VVGASTWADGSDDLGLCRTYRRKARTWNLGPLLPFDQALPEMQNLAGIDTRGELVEDVASPHTRLPVPIRFPHGLKILDDSQRAQRKPMP